jgi:NADH:ubiquinone oxidoreductase subunit K
MKYYFWEETLFNLDNINYIVPIDYIILWLLLLTSLIIILLGMIGLCIKVLSLLNILIFFEIILLGLNLWAICFALYFENIHGFLIVFLILTLAAAESALGLSLLVLLFRVRYNIYTEHFVINQF